MENKNIEYAIEIEHLSKKYKNKTVIEDLSFKVKKGNVFCYLGLNGAGKSTTINILCQVLERTSGDIKVLGKDIDKDSLDIKKEIGIVFQNSCLDKELSVYQNLKIKALLFGISKSLFKEKLNYLDELLDLKPILKSKYQKLSGGQKRRVDIAYGLINEPKLLFLDEPTTGLDPINREKVWNAIKTLIDKENITIFLTTHYMEEAELADDIIFIKEGKIIAQGTPNELKNKFSSNILKIYKKFNQEDNQKLKKYFNNVDYKNNCYLVKINNINNIIENNNDIKDLLQDIEIIKGNMQDVFLNVAYGEEKWN